MITRFSTVRYAGRKFIGPLVGLVVAGLLLAACGSDTANQSSTLRTAFSFDQGSLDPAVFYGTEGLMVTTSCYEGLLRYKDNSTKLEPWLAKSYDVSPDGLTYTFHLRPGVTFVDGTKFDSQAVKFSLDRQAGVNGGPAYMVAGIKSVDTPDPNTVVVKMKAPVNPFPHFLASPYGPKMMSPAMIKKHATAKDKWAQKWVAKNCAGTGPYQLAPSAPGRPTVLTAYKGYWGSKPGYQTVVFKMVPSFATQLLELKSGQLDMMTRGLSPNQIDQLSSDSKFHTTKLPSAQFIQVLLNSHKAPLNDPEVRKAVGLALDRKGNMQKVFGDAFEPATSVGPADTLDTKYGGAYTTPYDPQAAKAIVAKLPANQRNLSLVYINGDPADAQLAGLTAAQLQKAGFHVTTRGVLFDTVLAYPQTPASKRPSMIVGDANADDASPPSWPALFYSGSGGLSLFRPNSPAADKVLFDGMQSPSEQKALQQYGKAMDMYRDLNIIVPFGNRETRVVAKKNIEGIAAQRQGQALLNIPALRGQ